MYRSYVKILYLNIKMCKILFLIQILFSNILLISSYELTSNGYKLSQNDFKFGTFIINNPGTYILTENIEFKPNYPVVGGINSNPELFMFPTLNQLTDANSQYNSRAYSLGFFAAISINSDNVVLDLNNYELKQSDEHSLFQRFYANIEIGSSPFPTGGGPADFGTLYKSNYVTIKNGKLGHSSHHGIHGNSANYVTIENLEIYDFEVAGISLNDVDNLVIDKVNIHDSWTSVKTNGRWSASLFLLQAVSLHLDLVEHMQSEVDNLRNSVLDFYQNDIDLNGLFSNAVDGLPDASLLSGIIIHPKLNVGKIAHHGDFEEMNKIIKISNVVIDNLIHIPIETATLKSKMDNSESSYHSVPGSVSDPIGAAFQVEFAQDISNGNYLQNPLAELQLALANFSINCNNDNTCNLNESQKRLLKRNKISKSIIDWSNHLKTFDELKLDYDIQENVDIMVHAMKGTIGIKIDGTTDLNIKNVTVSNIINKSKLEHRSKLVDIDTKYNVFDSKGVLFAASVNIKGDHIRVYNISSYRNSPNNVDFVNECRDVKVNNLFYEKYVIENEDTDKEESKPNVDCPYKSTFDDVIQNDIIISTIVICLSIVIFLIVFLCKNRKQPVIPK